MGLDFRNSREFSNLFLALRRECSIHTFSKFAFFKYKLRLLVPRRLWIFISTISLKSKFNQWYFSERRPLHPIGRVNNPKFFIIRRCPPGAGFFSNVLFVVQGVIRAERLGLIPIVDFKNYYMHEMFDVGQMRKGHDVWHAYFQPFCEEDLQSVYKSKSFLLSSANKIGGTEDFISSKSVNWIFNTDKLRQVSQVVNSHLKFVSAIEEKLNHYKHSIAWNPQRTLAVSIRGGNYIKYDYDGHSIQPNLHEVFSKIRIFLSQYNITKIYPVTQEYSIFEQIEREFGELVIKPYSKAPFSNLDEFLALGPKEVPRHWDRGSANLTYEETNRYIIDVLLLAESKFMIGAPTNAVGFALAKNDFNYKSYFLFDKGTY